MIRGCVLILILVNPPADQATEAQALRSLEKYLAAIPDGQAGRVTSLANDLPIITASGHSVFTVRFRGYPIKPPKPFRINNLVVVDPDGNVEHFPDEISLKKFFVRSLKPITRDEDAKVALRTWLKLADPLYQDGYYTLKFDKASVRISTKDKKREVSGKAIVTKGGQGQISATLVFDASGTVSEILTRAELVPAGDRPVGGVR